MAGRLRVRWRLVMINELEIEETEGYIEISQSLGEESYLIIRCFPDGRIELLEISQYGGEERHCGFFGTIHEALEKGRRFT